MEISFWITLLLCFFVGISLGMLGGGGSILTVPIFVYAGRMSAESAIAMSLAIVGLVSLAGTWRFSTKGFFNKRLFLFFTVSGIPTAFAGAHFTTLISERYLLLLFGALMCFIAVILLIKSARPAQETAQPAVCRPGALLSLFSGAAIGFLTGFLGVGGGFLIVPAIALLMRCSLHTAIGTSLAIIAVNSFAGFLGHLKGLDLNLLVLVSAIAVMLPGTILGARFAMMLKDSVLQRGFAALILCTGIFIITQNIFI